MKALGLSEQDRTLSYRKNIMVKFNQNGELYTKMGVCFTSEGHPSGHIKGRLIDKIRPLPLKTCTYLTDHNKNVTGLADEEGHLVATWDYDAFGNIIRQTGPMASSNPLRFSSEYHDEDLGLVYYNYRHYNPSVGRWISRDPIEEKGGANLYGFVKNSSLYYYDILGEKLEKWEKDPNQIPLTFVTYLPGNEGGRTIANYGNKIISPERDPVNKGKWKPSISVPEKNIEILINENMGENPNFGNHSYKIKGKNQTTESHERNHAKIFIDEWNNNYESVNAYEISVCYRCYYYQSRLLSTAFDIFSLEIELKNMDFDAENSMENISFKSMSVLAQINSLRSTILSTKSVMKKLKCI